MPLQDIADALYLIHESIDYYHIWTYNHRFYSWQDPTYESIDYYHIWTYNHRFYSWQDPNDLPKAPPMRIATCKGHQSGVCGVIRGSRGQIISYSEDGTIRLWSNKNYACKLVLQGHTHI